MSEPKPDQGRYLFAVARGMDENALSGVLGLREAPLEIVAHRDLQAVVCTVDLEEFGEQQLPRHLEDLDWLEGVARAHNDVVFAVASVGTVAPMRLVTICTDDVSVAQRIEAIYDDLSVALDRVEGRREWSVKVYAPREEQPDPVDSARPTSGAAYLQKKRDLAKRRRSANDQSARRAEEIHEELSGHVAAARALPSQDPRLTGRTDTMILNAAYLVPIDEEDGFRDLVSRLGELHRPLLVEVEGPWPPYSFATLE